MAYLILKSSVTLS